jgi:hypothetical protein
VNSTGHLQLPLPANSVFERRSLEKRTCCDEGQYHRYRYPSGTTYTHNILESEGTVLTPEIVPTENHTSVPYETLITYIEFKSPGTGWAVGFQINDGPGTTDGSTPGVVGSAGTKTLFGYTQLGNGDPVIGPSTITMYPDDWIDWKYEFESGTNDHTLSAKVYRHGSGGNVLVGTVSVQLRKNTRMQLFVFDLDILEYDDCDLFPQDPWTDNAATFRLKKFKISSDSHPSGIPDSDLSSFLTHKVTANDHCGLYHEAAYDIDGDPKWTLAA